MLDQKANEFMAQKRIAVVGVSRTGQGTAAGIFTALRASGHEVFAVNPNVFMLGEDTVYPSLKAIPGGVDGAVIVTRPELTEKIVQDAAEAGVKRLWMHNNTLGASSVSEQAVDYCLEHQIDVIPGACPMMYLDPFHKAMKWGLGITGRLPEIPV